MSVGSILNKIKKILPYAASHDVAGFESTDMLLYNNLDKVHLPYSGLYSYVVNEEYVELY